MQLWMVFVFVLKVTHKMKGKKIKETQNNKNVIYC